MKKYELENYSIQITEKYMRYYYSAEAKILKNDTTTYDIKEGAEIPTSVAPIKIASLVTVGDDVFGVILEYYDKNANLQSVELNVNGPAVRIPVTEGNDDIWRTSLCELQFVEK